MNIDLTNEEIKALKSIMKKINSYGTEEDWTIHDGLDLPERDEYMEIKYKDGTTEAGFPDNFIGWIWEEESPENQVLVYRFVEDTRGHG